MSARSYALIQRKPPTLPFTFTATDSCLHQHFNTVPGALWGCKSLPEYRRTLVHLCWDGEARRTRGFWY